MGVKSSLSVAGGVSASFSKSASALNSVTSLTNTASRTNISGNATAVEAASTYGQGLKQLSTSLVTAGSKIHSVAKYFSEIDQQAAQKFQLNTSPMSRWFK